MKHLLFVVWPVKALLLTATVSSAAVHVELLEAFRVESLLLLLANHVLLCVKGVLASAGPDIVSALRARRGTGCILLKKLSLQVDETPRLPRHFAAADGGLAILLVLQETDILLVLLIIAALLAAVRGDSLPVSIPA